MDILEKMPVSKLENQIKKSVNLNCCLKCGRTLVKIGNERMNGKNHSDWTGRKYHKKCWKELNY